MTKSPPEKKSTKKSSKKKQTPLTPEQKALKVEKQRQRREQKRQEKLALESSPEFLAAKKAEEEKEAAEAKAADDLYKKLVAENEFKQKEEPVRHFAKPKLTFRTDDGRIMMGPVEFFPKKFKYKNNYELIVDEIFKNPKEEVGYYRKAFLTDLWFLLRAGAGVPGSINGTPLMDHQFWLDRCKEVQYGAQDMTVDVWGREHGKSTIITVARNIQSLLHNPSETIGIFSYTRTAAQAFLKQIKYILESAEILKACFPDILYQDPQKQASQWSLEGGLIVNRESNPKEASIEAWGLIEGMPTGKHFSRRTYDDIVTQDLVGTPDIMDKTYENFNLSQNLGTLNGIHQVVGTYYHYNDPLVRIVNKKDPVSEEPLYTVRKYPSTVDGTFKGKSVYLPEERLRVLRADRAAFNTQHCLDPNPEGQEKLRPEDLIEVHPRAIPKRLYKFMLVDPAGSEKRRDRQGDSWGIFVIGVVPVKDDTGASSIYILDGLIEEFDIAEAMDEIVDMYCRHGKILKLGVEKVGMSSAEIHVANALKARGRRVSKERGNLHILTPAGRTKQYRIESNLAWPLKNAKIHISSSVSEGVRERLKLEMRKFPFWHEDGIDAISYVYDIIKDYRFPMYYSLEEAMTEEAQDRYEARRAKMRLEKGKGRRGWMVA